MTQNVVAGMTMDMEQGNEESIAFNYACHLVRNYANVQTIVVSGKYDLLEISLVFCLLQLRLDVTPEQSAQLWVEEGEKAELTSLFFEPSFATCLLNILVSGSTSDLLKTRAIQVLVAGLSLPSNRFADMLIIAIDEINRENVVAALCNAMNATIRSNSPKADMIQSSCDLLSILVDNVATRFDVTIVARASSAHFPLNILFNESLETIMGAEHENVIRKLLIICKRLIDDPELQQSWSQDREQFNSLNMCTYHIVSPIAAEIVGMLGVERESDYSMQFANSFL
ncbi:hypothetical protein PRIPAC_74251 [Pristionchus pacificus]|uniref:Uncharacterized protein n=1 Tax=Pristionchus pacificus TaxID=54126 RepID=A0A2A6BFW3_PRIPA|nr:hypothetical protein PRIPAC_74251 [Pristionchus pacificus]|eukprot:PDM64753.1 hypothetical protein PRIPAC_53009 [Pristionchus pacificus]